MKRKDYWHKLKGDQDELQTQLTTNIIMNNLVLQPTTDWLTLLLEFGPCFDILLAAAVVKTTNTEVGE